MNHIYISKETYVRKKSHCYLREGCWRVRPHSPVSPDKIRSSYRAGKGELEDPFCRSKSKWSPLSLILTPPSPGCKLGSWLTTGFSLTGRLQYAGGRTREERVAFKVQLWRKYLVKSWTLNTKGNYLFTGVMRVGSLGKCKREEKSNHFLPPIDHSGGWTFCGPARLWTKGKEWLPLISSVVLWISKVTIDCCVFQKKQRSWQSPPFVSAYQRRCA